MKKTKDVNDVAEVVTSKDKPSRLEIIFIVAIVVMGVMSAVSAVNAICSTVKHRDSLVIGKNANKCLTCLAVFQTNDMQAVPNIGSGATNLLWYCRPHARPYDFISFSGNMGFFKNREPFEPVTRTGDSLENPLYGWTTNDHKILQDTNGNRSEAILLSRPVRALVEVTNWLRFQ